MAKRIFDLIFSFFGLAVLSPLLVVLALAVKVSDRGPMLFRQQRVGQGGKLFSIFKFRSMVVNAEGMGPSVTGQDDPRITRVGRFLRKTKFDELPQLWNVLRGEMSFVGPRPEVPVYVAKYTAEQRRVLALKPGITDPASLEFRDEEGLLIARGRRTEGERQRSEVGGQRADRGDVEGFYLAYCLPRKIELSLAYAARATVWRDMIIILRTVFPFVSAAKHQNVGRSDGWTVEQ